MASLNLLRPDTVEAFNNMALAITDKTEFVALCERALVSLPGAGNVRVNDEAVAAFATKIPAPPTAGGYGWNDYMSKEASAEPLDITRVFHEMAAISGQQGGFYTNQFGKVKKWEVKGSGAQAMVNKMADIRQLVAVPGYHDCATTDWQGALRKELMGTPYSQWRHKALSEFMPVSSTGNTAELLDEITNRDGVLQLDFYAATRIARHYPSSFGGDPFRKKAVLTMLLTAAHLKSRMKEGDAPRYILNTIAAMDYRVPQTLSAPSVGVLEYSDAFKARLEEQKGLKIHDPMIVLMRAGGAVAMHKLGEASGKPDDALDAAAWKTGRDLDKQSLALKPFIPLSTYI